MTGEQSGGSVKHNYAGLYQTGARITDPFSEPAETHAAKYCGKYEPVDITLLRHEMLEYKLVKSGMTQNEAHIIASRSFNYTAETEEYYASLKKH